MIDIKDDLAAKRLFELSFVLEESGKIDESLSIRESLMLYAPYEERFIIALARSYRMLGRMSEAGNQLKNSVFLYPKSELSSLQLFHFLWNIDKKEEAFEEMKRFQSISHSDDYVDIVREINDNPSSSN